MLEGADLAVRIESHQQCKTPLESVQYNNDMSIKDMLLHPLLSLILTTLKLSILQFVLFSLRGGNEWVFLGKSFFSFLHQWHLKEDLPFNLEDCAIYYQICHYSGPLFSGISGEFWITAFGIISQRPTKYEQYSQRSIRICTVKFRFSYQKF